MTLDDLALPFGIEQIGIAFRCVLALDEVGVVTDRLQPCAGRCVHAVGVDLIGRKMLCDILRHVRRKPAVLLPVEIMRGIGRVGDIDGVDAAALLLRNALKYPLRTGTFDAHADPGIFRFECSGETFAGAEFEGRVERHLALFLRSLDQGRRHFRRRRRRGLQRFGEQDAHGRGRRCLEQIASRPSAVPHRILPLWRDRLFRPL
jgi:hypothetical protein